MQYITDNILKYVCSPRPKDSNKGTFGRVLCICGSYSMAGAAILCGMGALKSGAGLVDMAVPDSIYPIVASRLIEPIYTVYNNLNKNNVLESLKKADSCVIGCGLSQNNPEFVYDLLEELKKEQKPFVLDADGLNCISQLPDYNFNSHIPFAVFTPHPGEMSRLMKKSVKDIQSDRINNALSFSTKSGAICVLKGCGTIVSNPLGKYRINTTGNPGMATGGSGDVLAGIIGALLARKIEPFKAACAGVYIHGKAGDIAAQKFSQVSMLPTDLINEIATVFLNEESKKD